jgi:hypothetical protein
MAISSAFSAVVDPSYPTSSFIDASLMCDSIVSRKNLSRTYSNFPPFSQPLIPHLAGG